MIVVGSNVLAYFWVHGERTAVAHQVRALDAGWHAPILWRSEIRSALAGYIAHGAITVERAADVMTAAEEMMSGCEHLVASAVVLELAAATGLSAYDCEFVALAQALAVKLVTEDRAVLKAFPKVALSMDAFLAASPRIPPAAHEKSARYRARPRARSI